MAVNHGHAAGQCDEPEPPTGSGQCPTCRYYVRKDPGSEAAVKAGCTCPVIDNNRGAGYLGQPGVFVMTVGCPLHGGER